MDQGRSEGIRVDQHGLGRIRHGLAWIGSDQAWFGMDQSESTYISASTGNN